jgi:UDP-3-O-[3-hydroxymyristoyl] glucosamine N-acyltransferase
MKLKEIADIVGGNLVGESDLEVESVAPIDVAGEGVLTFAASERYLKAIERSKATCIIVPRGLKAHGKNLIEVDDPRLALARAMEVMYKPEKVRAGIEEGAYVAGSAEVAPSSRVCAMAYISDRARIGESTVISPFCYIGPGAVVGRGCFLHSGVAICHGVVIGDRVTIHSNAVLGSDGFGYARDECEHRKIPQIGTVVVEDDVEIGASACLDRATLGETRIGRGTKIDNLVHVAHNVTIGENCLVVAQVGIAGSTEIGEDVTIGGQAGLVHHIKIGSKSVIGAQAGVTRSFPEGSTISGYPARDHNKSMKGYAALSKLPSLFKEIREIEERLDRLDKERGKTSENTGR